MMLTWEKMRKPKKEGGGKEKQYDFTGFFRSLQPGISVEGGGRNHNAENLQPLYPHAEPLVCFYKRKIRCSSYRFE